MKLRKSISQVGSVKVKQHNAALTNFQSIYLHIYISIYHLYICIYYIFGEFACRIFFTQFYACSIFCKCEPLLTVHAHADTEGMCLYLLVSAAVKTPQKAKFKV